MPSDGHSHWAGQRAGSANARPPAHRAHRPLHQAAAKAAAKAAATVAANAVADAAADAAADADGANATDTAADAVRVAVAKAGGTGSRVRRERMERHGPTVQVG